MFFTVVEIIIFAFVKDYIHWITIAKNLPQTEWIKMTLVTGNLQNTSIRFGAVFSSEMICTCNFTYIFHNTVILQQFYVNFMSVVNFTEKNNCT